jgi:hypothetical protein
LSQSFHPTGPTVGGRRIALFRRRLSRRYLSRPCQRRLDSRLDAFCAILSGGMIHDYRLAI